MRVTREIAEVSHSIAGTVVPDNVAGHQPA